MTLLKKLFGLQSQATPERDLYAAAMSRARQPRCFTEWGVPDTVEGRYDMLVMHIYPILRRLKGQGRKADALAQALFDLMFADMDQSLRELGIGDTGMGRRIKDLGGTLYGRAKAYDGALDAGAADTELQDAVTRNVFAGDDAGDAVAVAAYLRDMVERIDAMALDDLFAGQNPYGESS